jgi:hypothetical protein
LRFTRSAQTPAKIDTIAWGKKPKTAANARITPDLVVKVRCHIIAYCTKKDPNIEIVCALRNRAARRAQPGIDSLGGVSFAVDGVSAAAISSVLEVSFLGTPKA